MTGKQGSRKMVLALFMAVVVAAQLFAGFGTQQVSAANGEIMRESKELKLWYTTPAPDSITGWEKQSLPLGNGYMGASVFGRTDRERVQITENSLANPYSSHASLSQRAGLGNFAEIYLQLNHDNVTNYSRDLLLNDATAHVQYDYNGVTYSREYFTSYPDKVLVIKLEASEPGKLDFTLCPEIPHLGEWMVGSNDYGKDGEVTAEGDTITLSGNMRYFNIDFEGQVKVIPDGGTMKTNAETIDIAGANSAVILLAVATNYELDSAIFLENNPTQKLKHSAKDPHKVVSEYLAEAAKYDYAALRQRHVADYKQYFDSVVLDFGGQVPTIPTNELLSGYTNSSNSNGKYLEELFFQYGRYMLIASSREGNLPANLQGIWNAHKDSPWSVGYWHNINVQMNYWPAFITGLSDMFLPFVDYNEAYRDKAELIADSYLEATGSAFMAEPGTGENGWIIGTGARPYDIGGPTPGGHSGPGTGALTTQMFWDYYDFTRDEVFLQEHALPAIEGMAKFLSKSLIEDEETGLLLTYPSASPENTHRGTSNHIQTTGSTFDQQMVYENHLNLIRIYDILGLEDSEMVALAREQIALFDPVPIGYSGQVKEYREEDYYGDLGDPAHRHISQLVGLMPGQSINSTTPVWLDAAKVTLTGRGYGSSGWSYAHRQLLWARAGEGDRAYEEMNRLLKNRVLPNLWDAHNSTSSTPISAWQIDGNLGTTAGMAEMLLETNEQYFAPLSGLPSNWAGKGSFKGLVARGNFEVSASWADSRAQRIEVKSNAGGTLSMRYPRITEATIRTLDGGSVAWTRDTQDPHVIHIQSAAGETYLFTDIPEYSSLAAPVSLTSAENAAGDIVLRWEGAPGSVSYNLYMSDGTSPQYEVLAENTTETSFAFQLPEEYYDSVIIFKVTANAADGTETKGRTVVVAPISSPESAYGYVLDSGYVHIAITPVNKATGYALYKQVNGAYELVRRTSYSDMYLEYEPGAEYYVQTISGVRSSGYTLVEMRDGYQIDNVLLNKTVTASKTANTTYPLSHLVDGNLGSRMALADNGADTTITIKLGSVYSLDELRIYEFENSGNGTRGGETTIWVYNEGEEKGDPVFTGTLVNPAEEKYTSIAMGQAAGDTVQFLFKNTNTHPNQVNKTITMYEITCSGTLAGYTDKSELAMLLNKAEDLRPETMAHTEAVVNLQLAQNSAYTVFGQATATNDDLAKASESLSAAIEAYLAKEQRPNILLRKAISANPDGRPGYGTEYLNDGDINTRCAPLDNGRQQTVTFDLGGIYVVDSAYVVEFIEGGNREGAGQTRGGQSSVEVFTNGEWKTVWSGSLEEPESIPSSAIKQVTEIEYEPVAASQMRFTFYNTWSAEKSPTIWEISAAGEASTVDTTGLQALVNESAALQEADYTVGSWLGFKAALDAATAVLVKPAPAQAEVEDAHTTLESAKNALVYIGGLQAEFLQHKDKQQGSYTDESWQAFKTALDKAAEVLGEESATVQQVEDALTVLRAAVAGLVEEPGKEPDKTALQELYNKHKDRQQDGYTEESWNVFVTALENAWNALENGEIDQTGINAAHDGLSTAIAGLRADKTTLAGAIAEAQALKQEAYTPDSWLQMAAALYEAVGVNGRENATPAEVAEATRALRLAIDALTPVNPIDPPPDPATVDKGMLQKLYDENSKRINDGYTEDTWYTFLGALDDAARVLKNENATQRQVDVAVQGLQDAVQALTQKARLAILDDSILAYREDNDIVIRVDADIESFRNAYLGGQLLTRGTQYTVEPGSTVITLPASLFAGLANGEYEFYAEFSAGVAQAKVLVDVRQPGGSSGGGNGSNSGSAGGNGSSSAIARTGDGSGLGMYSIIALAAIAVAAGLVVLRIRGRKKS